jgi:hypothetical protein
MRTKLSQLKLSDFIELSTGNTKVLLGANEFSGQERIVKVARDIFNEYWEIADPKGMKVRVLHSEDTQKLKMKVDCLRICYVLALRGNAKDVRDVLNELEINVTDVQDEALAKRVKSILNGFEFEMNRAEEEEPKKELTEKDIRRSFDSEIAFLMTYFKMPISMDISASIYANLVHQCKEDIKARSRSMNSQLQQ